jgi:hypothetical protein
MKVIKEHTALRVTLAILVFPVILDFQAHQARQVIQAQKASKVILVKLVP